MAQLTNLTDRISQLRDQKQSSAVLGGRRQEPPPPKQSKRADKRKEGPRERKLATDTFMLFAYTLLGIALACQLFLIVWLDVI